MQKMLGAVLIQNWMLTAASAQAEASRPGQHTKQDTSAWPKGPNIKGYHVSIIKIGKSFTVVQLPWVNPSAFTAKISFPVTSPPNIWKPNSISVLFPQQLTAMIYQHIPEHFHRLVNTADLPEFAANFCHHTSTERSSTLKTLKVKLRKIFLAQKLINNVTDPAAWRGLRRLAWPGRLARGCRQEEDQPIPTPQLSQKYEEPHWLYEERSDAAVSKCTCVILFGPASLEDKAVGDPKIKHLGNCGTLESQTQPSSPLSAPHLEDQKPKSFAPVGATSKIDFREIYMHFRSALESKAEDASPKSVIHFWHQRVFKGITDVAALPTTNRVSERINEEAELKATMGGLDVEGGLLVYSNEEDFDSAINTLASAAIVCARGPDPAPTGRGQPAIAATATIDSQVIPHPRVVLGPSTASDDGVDESVESLVRPSNRRSQARVIVDSEDNAPSQPEEDGRCAEDLCVQLEAKLKFLKVVDLWFVPTTAYQLPAQKAKKDDLIAAILASKAAINMYRANFHFEP
ncbi:hypothetical protein B0H14DRAFT_2597235 [Mycena olivaceomarginata]|nr:hypothetical protein B0H14DRAFT_2597235 [Mycena olivaceomarginata]